jgi:hypothetical protein
MCKKISLQYHAFINRDISVTLQNPDIFYKNTYQISPEN